MRTTIHPIRLIGMTMAVGGSAFAGQAKTPVTRRPSDPYITLRTGLPNAAVRFEREQRGRVAFLGGSITHMADGWRSMTCEILRKRFPNTEFDFIDAGIPSTDTALGPFRLKRDVLARGRVDLLLVEFAVNDSTNGRSDTESVRGMEGIVRKARAHNPCIDVVILYFVDPDKMAVIRRGKTPAVIVSHEKVAQHYGIPVIDLAREVTERIDAGEFDWNTFGGLHPAAFGHRVYARSIDRLFELAWLKPPAKETKVQPHVMPARPVDPLNYDRGRFVDLKEARIVSGWQLVPSWRAKKGHTRPGFVNVPMLVADAPGATLTLTFTGTAIGLLEAAGYDVGVIEFAIDGRPPRRVDQFTQWSHDLHIPWVYMLNADLEPGRHELTLRTTDQKHPKSEGHAARIVAFLAN